MNEKQQKQMREEFEVWYPKKKPPRYNEGYLHHDPDICWKAWQAAYTSRIRKAELLDELIDALSPEAWNELPDYLQRQLIGAQTWTNPIH